MRDRQPEANRLPRPGCKSAPHRRIAFKGGSDGHEQGTGAQALSELHAGGNTSEAREILADSYVDRDIPGLGEGGREELIGAVVGVRAAIPDVAPQLGPILAEGDLVAVRVVASGSHTGAPFPPGIPASGARITWKEQHVFRCADGQIVEHWGVFDMLGILQQLGAIPGPA